jgi:hypothetical protein
LVHAEDSATIKEAHTMKPVFSAAFLFFSMATQAGAQEAFVTQVGGIRVTATVPARVTNPAQGILAGVAQLTSSIQVGQHTFRDDLLPGIPSTGTIATVTQTGNTNTASITQNGLHAALIQQTGFLSNASIQQHGGTMNRAAIQQTSSGSTAGIVQNGSGNRALIIQN